jgi:hypothetical protein
MRIQVSTNKPYGSMKSSVFSNTANSEIIKDIKDIMESEKEFPSVSILFPVNKKYPQFTEAEQKLKQLIKKAELEMKEHFSSKIVESISVKLHEIIKLIDFKDLSDSLAIYVSPSFHKVIHLSFPVEEKLIIGRTFELRDLFYLTINNFNYIVITISKNLVRQFLGNDHFLIEEKNANMPNGIADVEGEGHSRVQSFSSFASTRNVSDQNKFVEIKLEKYFRDIDNELTTILKKNNFPVIIGGVKKEVALFKSITKNSSAIMGDLEGNFDYSAISEILNKIQPVLKNRFKTKQEKVLQLLDEAIGKKKFASGISDVWTAVMAKRGRVLIVEKDYHCVAKSGKNKSSLEFIETEENGINIVKDAVDDIIEFVFMYGGEVVFVDNGKLNAHHKIALITHYS